MLYGGKSLHAGAMPDANFEDIDSSGSDDFIKSVSSRLPWVAPSIHKMNLMQSRTGPTEGPIETYTVLGGSFAPPLSPLTSH